MESSIIDLSKYRYQTAVDDLETARINIREGKYKQAVNRSYYAIFHAIRAVTALDGFDSRKHSGVISFFNKQYVKAGIFNKEISKIINNAFNMRENADYQDFFIVSKIEAEKQIEDANVFLEKIHGYIINRWGKD